ncbi:hypothetical protein D0867_02465 [Hortaea werneckii]|uniref:ABM domain-containing protein n=1 Tax=Hortaea werneckii TaxID=91943 RepID=A0A3M7A5V8_HORWE|nr:hypothetical protein D0867_02465 [Hortaea werneckii]RMY36394.1 hypothetical protein D0866_03969 [Hortaea werneckii]
MASKEFNVIAILHPKKGKTDIVLRQLNEVAEYVQKNEPGVLSYSINRSLRPSKDGEEEIIMLERYKDQAALKEHGSSQTFTAFNKKLAEQDLMRAPMVLKMGNAGHRLPMASLAAFAWKALSSPTPDPKTSTLPERIDPLDLFAGVRLCE